MKTAPVGLGQRNIERIKRFCDVVNDQMEIDRFEESKTRVIKIPFFFAKSRGLSIEEIRSINAFVSKTEGKQMFKILNDEPYIDIEKEWPNFDYRIESHHIYQNEAIKRRLHEWIAGPGRIEGVTKDDLNQNIVLKLITAEVFNSLKNETSEVVEFKLEGRHIEFDPEQPAIIIDGNVYSITYATNLHSFLKVMFKHKKCIFVEWTDIFEDMNSLVYTPQGRNKNKDKKSIQDTMYALNEKISDYYKTKDRLFSWKNGTVKRNY